MTEAYLVGFLDGWYDRAHRIGEEDSHDERPEWTDYHEGYVDGWNRASYLPDRHINEGRLTWNQRIARKWMAVTETGEQA